jgi:hypothetical protein
MQSLSTYTGQHNTEKHGHTSMPQAVFKPTIPVFEWLKTVCALDHMVNGTSYLMMLSILKLNAPATHNVVKCKVTIQIASQYSEDTRVYPKVSRLKS